MLEVVWCLHIAGIVVRPQKSLPEGIHVIHQGPQQSLKCRLNRGYVLDGL